MLILAVESFNLDMRTLMEEALSRNIKAEDLFETTGCSYDAATFFDRITAGKDPAYRQNAVNRILSNKPGDKFYDVLLHFLDSRGINKPYKKLPPALIRRRAFGPFEPVDGRHRAALCLLLDIKYIPIDEV